MRNGFLNVYLLHNTALNHDNFCMANLGHIFTGRFPNIYLLVSLELCIYNVPDVYPVFLPLSKYGKMLDLAI